MIDGPTRFIAHRREKDGAEQELWIHLRETSSLAGQIAKKIGLQQHGELIGLLHDLGKASLEFDQYIRSATGLLDPDADGYVDASEKKGKIDHSTAGGQVIYRSFVNRGAEGVLAAQMLALPVVSHHSGLIDCLSPYGEDAFSRRMLKSNDLTRKSEAELNMNEELQRALYTLIKNDSIVPELYSRIKSMIESNDSSETVAFKMGLLVKILLSCLLDADRLNTADFEFPENAQFRNYGHYTQWHILVDRLEKHIGQFEATTKLNILRKEISDSCLEFSSKCKGLYQLTVPTGGGKTLASLRFALNHAQKHDMDRIIYITPYTSIIDQNADVTRKILEDRTDRGDFLNRIVLEHHSNLTPEEESTRQKLLSENWDAPVVFTTMVQFLETVFGDGTRSARRMHQLANAVLIFDEIQTIPVRCVHMFNTAMRFLLQACSSTVVLCTATQPLLDKVDPKERALSISCKQQMMKDVQKLFDQLRRVNVENIQKTSGWTDEEIVGLAIAEVDITNSVLIVVNTKKSAHSLTRILQADPTLPVAHLSTSMCPAHRLEALEYIKERLRDKKPIICVSTQLIEAGVDIDFGTVIRFVAGLDSIAQAAGRCNRNGERPILGRVLIVNPKEESLDKLRDIAVGKEVTKRFLDEYAEDPQQFDGDIIGPKALARYYHYYFYQRADEMAYRVSSSSKVERDDNLFELLSMNRPSVEAYKRKNGKLAPRIALRQAFKTAAEEFRSIDSYTRGVIVPYGAEGVRVIADLCSTSSLEQQYRLLKRAQRYSVNVLYYLFDQLVTEGVIREVQKGSGVFHLDHRYYSKQYGLSETPTNEMEVFIVEEVCNGKQDTV